MPQLENPGLLTGGLAIHKEHDMPPTLALHKAALDHIGPQLAALNLNLKVITFDGSGEFEIDGARVPTAEVSIDYLWFSRHINSDGNAAGAFEMALSCRHVGVLQTLMPHRLVWPTRAPPRRQHGLTAYSRRCRASVLTR